MSSLCVIIPAYNHAAEVLTAICSLRFHRSASPELFSIHVQDDASPEVMLPGCVPPEVATVWRNDPNKGFAGNCNAGAAWVQAHYNPAPDLLMFINQDVSAVPQFSFGWDAAIRKAFDEHPEVGIVGARLLFPDGKIQNMGGDFDQATQPTHRMLGWSDPKSPTTNRAGYVDWTTGAALAIRTSLFNELGGFNEQYAGGYFEDVDLCLRAVEAGHRIWIEPGATLIHTVASTGGSPHFKANAARFKREWVDTGKVKPGVRIPTVRYW